MTEWISVEDGLPKHDGEVLVLCGDGYKEIGYQDDEDAWWIGHYSRMDGKTPARTVTHYAEIDWPESPEEAKS